MALSLQQEIQLLRALQAASGGVGGQGAGDAGNALGIYGGLQSGTPMGYTRAGLNAANLGSRTGAFGGASGDVGNLANIGGSLLNMYNGIEHGGLTGYGGAALSGIKAANTADQMATGSGFLGGNGMAALGGAGDILGIYNGIKQGGPLGYGSAALDAYQLYNTAAPYVSSLFGSGAAGAGAGADAAAAGADAAAGAGSAGAGVGALAGAGMGLGALGGLYALYGLDMKQGRMSPVTNYNDAMATSQFYQNRAANEDPAAIGRINSGVLENRNGSMGGESDQRTAASARATNTAQAQQPMYTMQDAQRQDLANAADQRNEANYFLQNNIWGARGGHIMKKLYEGSFADRVNHFDDGGYVDYAGTSGDVGPDGMTNITVSGNNPPPPPIDPQPWDFSRGFTDPTIPSAGSLNPDTNFSSLGPLYGMLGSSNALGQLWNGLSGGQQLGILGGLLGAAGAASNRGSNMTQQYHPAPPAMFSNTGPAGTAQNASKSNMYGNFTTTPRTQVNPGIANYATYGQGPEHAFFSGVHQGPSPVTPQVPVNPAMMHTQPIQPHPYPLSGQPSLSQLIGAANQPMQPSQMMHALSHGGAPFEHFGPGGGVHFQPPRLNPGAFRPPTPAAPPPQRPKPTAPNEQGVLQGQPTQSDQPDIGDLSDTEVNKWMPGITKYFTPPKHAHGGAGEGAALQGHRAQGFLSGPGDGTSDDIVPAALSAGEYVIPAHVVSALGNGDNRAGAKRLDEFQKNVRTRTGKQMAKNQHPTGHNRAMQPQSYLPKGAK